MYANQRSHQSSFIHCALCNWTSVGVLSAQKFIFNPSCQQLSVNGQKLIANVHHGLVARWSRLFPCHFSPLFRAIWPRSALLASLRVTLCHRFVLRITSCSLKFNMMRSHSPGETVLLVCRVQHWLVHWPRQLSEMKIARKGENRLEYSKRESTCEMYRCACDDASSAKVGLRYVMMASAMVHLVRCRHSPV